MENVAVLGGCGYLGSIITNELVKQECTVDIIDNVIFSKEHAENCDFIEKDCLFDDISYDSYDKVVWCIDIDTEIFYTYPCSKNYVKKNVEKFKELCEMFGENFYFVTENYDGNVTAYNDMLINKERIVNANNSHIFCLPCLYGPSSRMRFDTEVNKMFMWAYNTGMLVIENWVKKRVLCSVAVAGTYIANYVATNRNDGGLNFIGTTYLSMAEISIVMNKVFEERLQIMYSDLSVNISNREENVDWLDSGRHTLFDDMKYMYENVEGSIGDMSKDYYSNENMLSSLDDKKNIFEFINKLKS